MEKVALRTTLKEQPSDRDYWLSRPISERLAAVEQFRLQMYPLSNPDNHAKHRLQRVYRVTTLHEWRHKDLADLEVLNSTKS
jgi:hypothetical protein